MDNTQLLNQLLAKRIATANAEAGRSRRLGFVACNLALLPLVVLAIIAVTVIRDSTAWWGNAGVVMACLACAMLMWTTGNSFSDQAAQLRRRVQNLEDIEMFLAAISPDKIASEQLLALMAGLKRSDSDDMLSSVFAADHTRSASTVDSDRS